MNWYAVKTQNNKEKEVQKNLTLELERSGLKHLVGKCLIPIEKSFMTKNGKKISRDKTVFPGYLFIETSSVGEVSSILKTIKGSSGFVKINRSGDIKPLSRDEVVKILKIEDSYIESGSTHPMHDFKVGEEIRIIDGPFDTFKGKVVSIESDKSRLKVGVTIFGRVTDIDLEFSQVERIY